MITITVLGEEFFNEKTSEVYTKGDVVLELEHSLATLSKWEAIYEKPFLTQDEKTSDEVIAYIEIMIQTPNFPPGIITRFSEKNFKEINDYMNSKQTATWFAERRNEPKSREVITSELIYYWIIAFNIPMECQFWHINRLFTLIRVCSVKSAGNEKTKKKPTSSDLEERRRLNAKRQAMYNTTG